MCDCEWFWWVEGSTILLIFLWRHVHEQWAFDFWPLYFIQVPKAGLHSLWKSVKYHGNPGFLTINPTKRGCQGGWGQKYHSVSKALAFLAFWGQRGCWGCPDSMVISKVIIHKSCDELFPVSPQKTFRKQYSFQNYSTTYQKKICLICLNQF
jgi:hypothetical protein